MLVTLRSLHRICMARHIPHAFAIHRCPPRSKRAVGLLKGQQVTTAGREFEHKAAWHQNRTQQVKDAAVYGSMQTSIHPSQAASVILGTGPAQCQNQA